MAGLHALVAAAAMGPRKRRARADSVGDEPLIAEEAERLMRAQEAEAADSAGSSPGPLGTPLLLVRFHLKDGLGNVLWRTAAAVRLAIAIDARARNRKTFDASDEPRSNIAVLAVEPHDIQNASPHAPSSPSYTKLWPSATSLDDFKQGDLTARWINGCPAILTGGTKKQLWAHCNALGTMTDVPHDREFDADEYDTVVTDAALWLAARASHGEVAVVELMGCWQRAAYIPPLPLLRTWISYEHYGRNLGESEIVRALTSEAATLASCTDTEEAWAVHFRGGDYKKLLAVRRGDYEAMLEMLARCVEEAIELAYCRGRKAQLHLYVAPGDADEAEAWWTTVRQKRNTQLTLVARRYASKVKFALPAEIVDMLRIGQYAHGVCSASSFAWWAFALSRRAENIVLPHPWLGLFGDMNSMLVPAHPALDDRPWRWMSVSPEEKAPPRHRLRKANKYVEIEAASEGESEGESDSSAGSLSLSPPAHYYFLKTYGADLHWAQLCLLAFIQHHRPTPGVQEALVVMCSRDGREQAALEDLLSRVKEEARDSTWREDPRSSKLPELTISFRRCAFREGYNAQQAEKLAFALEVDAYVTYIDSDVAAEAPFGFATFVPDGQRPLLLYSDYKSCRDAEVWRVGTARFLGMAPEELTYEYMRRLPLTYHSRTVMYAMEHMAREMELPSADAAVQWIRDRDTAPPDDLHVSEFNIVGAFAAASQTTLYCLVETQAHATQQLRLDAPKWPFVQRWSQQDRNADPAKWRVRAGAILDRTISRLANSLVLPSGFIVPRGDSHFTYWLAVDGLEHQRGLAETLDAALTAWLAHATTLENWSDTITVQALDVGAHCGSVSRIMLDLLKATLPETQPGLLVSIEPNPTLFEALTLNSRLLTRISRAMSEAGDTPVRRSVKWAAVNSLAVDAEEVDGQLPPHYLLPPGREDSAGIMNAEGIRAGTNYGAAYGLICDAPGAIPVSAVRLDEICDNTNALALIKIDVEGFETYALRGCEIAIKKWRPAIVAEVAPAHLRRVGSSVRELLNQLADWGYLPYSCVNGRLFARAPSMKAFNPTSAQEDVLFLHTDAVPYMARPI